MVWLLVDVAVALAALVALVVGVLRLWRRVKALTARVGEASESVATAQDALATAQATAPARRRVG